MRLVSAAGGHCDLGMRLRSHLSTGWCSEPGLARELWIRPQKAAWQPLVEAGPGPVGREGAPDWRALGRGHVEPSWLVRVSGQQQESRLADGAAARMGTAALPPRACSLRALCWESPPSAPSARQWGSGAGAFVKACYSPSCRRCWRAPRRAPCQRSVRLQLAFEEGE